MPPFRSTFFLNTISANNKRQASNSVLLNRQIDAVVKNLERTLIDYSEKDRLKIARKAANEVAKAARRNPGFSDSKRPHYRSSGENRIEYKPGNLRRSLKVLRLKRSNDAYVGPQFATKRASSYGGVGSPVDGYYAAMLYGSGAAFQSRVLIPALRRGKPAAEKILIKESEKAIEKRGVRRGFKTR